MIKIVLEQNLPLFSGFIVAQGADFCNFCVHTHYLIDTSRRSIVMFSVAQYSSGVCSFKLSCGR